MPALICFTMDNLGDAADLGRGVIQQPRQPGMRPALERGFPAMLDLFDRFDVRITHFVEGWSGEAHPDAIRELLRRGHSLGMHGWQHENWAALSDGRARELARRATQALAQAGGVRPLAFRAPGGRRAPNTARLLTRLGYRIDASLDPGGAEGGEIRALNDKLWTVPYEWLMVDASHWLWKTRSCDEVEGLWRQALDQAALQHRPLTFIWHPHIMGIDAGRRAVGENILRYVSEDERFQAVTLEALIRHCQRH